MTSQIQISAFYKPTLKRTLSYAIEAREHACPYMNMCEEGQSILTNFWMNGKSIHLSYMIKVNGLFEEKEISGDIEEIPRFWDYRSCPFEF